MSDATDSAKTSNRGGARSGALLIPKLKSEFDSIRSLYELQVMNSYHAVERGANLKQYYDGSIFAPYSTVGRLDISLCRKSLCHGFLQAILDYWPNKALTADEQRVIFPYNIFGAAFLTLTTLGGGLLTYQAGSKVPRPGGTGALHLE